jgi:hypothetical protein
MLKKSPVPHYALPTISSTSKASPPRQVTPPRQKRPMDPSPTYSDNAGRSNVKNLPNKKLLPFLSAAIYDKMTASYNGGDLEVADILSSDALTLQPSEVSSRCDSAVTANEEQLEEVKEIVLPTMSLSTPKISSFFKTKKTVAPLIPAAKLVDSPRNFFRVRRADL